MVITKDETLKDETFKLIKQQQVAHKLILGFYQTILGNIAQIAENCGFEFHQWKPTETAKPARNHTFPLKNWIWDFTPLYASTYEYVSKNSSTTTEVGECILIFRLYCDEGFRKKNRDGKYVAPLNLSSGDGALYVYIYRAIRKNEKNIMNLYDRVSWLKTEDSWQKTNNDSLIGYFKKFLLADFLIEPEKTNKHIKELTAPDYKGFNITGL